MNERERFLSVINFEPVDRTMIWEAGCWVDAVRRWHREGLPHRYEIGPHVAGGSMVAGEIHPSWVYGAPFAPEQDKSHLRAAAQEIHDYFGMDQAMVRVPLAVWMCPAFKRVILEDHGDWVVSRDRNGITKKEWKDRHSLPHWFGYPVNNRDDWEEIKAERLRPTLAGRLPANWPELKASYAKRTYPIVFGGPPAGFYGGARHLLGQEKVLTAFYDDPELMHDIMDYLADFYCAIYSKLLAQVDADTCFLWEDMCYRNGPLISPAMFREFMLPSYKKLTSCLRDCGVRGIMVDTDGDARQLIPLFIEGGVNIMYTLEPPAGMDVVDLRDRYPRLAMMGGMDKHKLAENKHAIDEELERKIPFMLKRGGYIPHLDHQTPPNVPWENFAHYRSKLNAMIRGEWHAA